VFGACLPAEHAPWTHLLTTPKLASRALRTCTFSIASVRQQTLELTVGSRVAQPLRCVGPNHVVQPRISLGAWPAGEVPSMEALQCRGLQKPHCNASAGIAGRGSHQGHCERGGNTQSLRSGAPTTSSIPPVCADVRWHMAMLVTILCPCGAHRPPSTSNRCHAHVTCGTHPLPGHPLPPHTLKMPQEGPTGQVRSSTMHVWGAPCANAAVAFSLPCLVRVKDVMCATAKHRVQESMARVDAREACAATAGTWPRSFRQSPCTAWRAYTDVRAGVMAAVRVARSLQVFGWQE
jgi:hypothetical protein